MPTISNQQPMRPAEIDLVDQVNTNTDDLATQTARVTQEVTDRTNADNALGNRITTETNRATAAESTLTQNLATEVNYRKTADNTLQVNIDAEVSRAKEAERANSNAISDEVTERKNNVSMINQTTKTLENNLNIANNNIATETTNRETRDTELTNLINKVAGVSDASAATFNANVKGNADAIDTLQGKFPVATADLAEAIQQQLAFLQSVPAMEFGTKNNVDVSANSNITIDITFGSAKTEAPVVLCGLQHESGNLVCVVTGVTSSQFSVNVYNLTSTDVTGVTVNYLAISRR